MFADSNSQTELAPVPPQVPRTDSDQGGERDGVESVDGQGGREQDPTAKRPGERVFTQESVRTHTRTHTHTHNIGQYLDIK